MEEYDILVQQYLKGDITLKEERSLLDNSLRILNNVWSIKDNVEFKEI